MKISVWQTKNLRTSTPRLQQQKLEDFSEIVLPGETQVKKLDGLYMVTNRGAIKKRTDETMQYIFDNGYKIVKRFDYNDNTRSSDDMLINGDNTGIPTNQTKFITEYEKLPIGALMGRQGQGYHRKSRKKTGGALSDAFFNISSFERVHINPATGKSIYVLSF